MMSSSAAALEAPTLPNKPALPTPPRYWWLKRLGLMGFLLSLPLVGVHFTWQSWSRTAWDRFVTERRAAGQPVLIDDFVPAAAPDEENGAKIMMDVAARSAAIQQPNLPNVDEFTELGAVRAFQSLAHAAIRDRADLLCDLRSARDLPRTNWGTIIASPLITVLMPYLSSARNVAKLTCVAALVEHDGGNDAEAVEMLIDGLEVGVRLRRTEFPCVITDLVAIACDSLAAATVESLSCELLIDDGLHGSASRAQVRELIRRLLDERELLHGSQRSLFGERVWMLDTFQCLESGKLGPMFVGWIGLSPARLFLPAWRLDCIRTARNQTMLAEALQAPDWPAAQSNSPPEPTEELDPIVLLATQYGRTMNASLSNAVALQYRGRATRRMAAIGLAIRLFELDHARLPDDLNELVPHYLVEIPLDPLAADGRPIGYVKTDGLPRLYSIGLDGVDQNGRIEYKDGIPRDSRDELLFFLTDRPRSARADLYDSYKLFEAYENDRKVEGDEGNDDQQNEGEQQGGDGPE